MHIEAGHPTQLDVQDDAVDLACVRPLQVFLRRSERHGLHSRRAEEPGHRARVARFVLDDRDSHHDGLRVIESTLPGRAGAPALWGEPVPYRAAPPDGPVVPGTPAAAGVQYV